MSSSQNTQWPDANQDDKTLYEKVRTKIAHVSSLLKNLQKTTGKTLLLSVFITCSAIFLKFYLLLSIACVVSLWASISEAFLKYKHNLKKNNSSKQSSFILSLLWQPTISFDFGAPGYALSTKQKISLILDTACKFFFIPILFIVSISTLVYLLPAYLAIRYAASSLFKTSRLEDVDRAYNDLKKASDTNAKINKLGEEIFKIKHKVCIEAMIKNCADQLYQNSNKINTILSASSPGDVYQALIELSSQEVASSTGRDCKVPTTEDVDSLKEKLALIATSKTDSEYQECKKEYQEARKDYAHMKKSLGIC